MKSVLLGMALVAGAGLSAGPAGAQTAYEINRLNQAVQICNSPMGAGMAECAQLRARLGGGGGVPGVSGFGGGGAGKAAGIASLLGAALTVARSQSAAAPPAPADGQPASNSGSQPAPNPFGSLLPRR